MNSILDRVEKLAQDKQGVRDVLTLLQLVKEMDERGTLERLNELLRQIGPLAKGKTAKLLLDKLDSLEKIITVLLKEE